MADNGNLVLQILTFILALILLFGSFTWFSTPVIKVPTAKEIAAEISIPEAPGVDLTLVEEGIIDIQNTLDEEDNWKAEAIALATEEWEKRDYREIYKAIDDIYDDIDEREDIKSVIVKDEEVTSFDIDDKDATVVQDLKVKYEDINGDTIKVYLTVTSIIEEGEVEDQEIEETD